MLSSSSLSKKKILVRSILPYFYANTMATAFDLQRLTDTVDMTLDEMQHHPELLINAFDKDHHVIFWNDISAKFFGISPEEALGKKLADLLPYTRNDERMVWLERGLQGQEIQILNGRYKQHRGSYEQRIIPIRDENGVVCGVANVVKNL